MIFQLFAVPAVMVPKVLVPLGVAVAVEAAAGGIGHRGVDLGEILGLAEAVVTAVVPLAVARVRVVLLVEQVVLGRVAVEETNLRVPREVADGRSSRVGRRGWARRREEESVSIGDSRR